MAERSPMSPDVVVSDTRVGEAKGLMHPLTHMPLAPVTDSAPLKQMLLMPTPPPPCC